MTENDPEIQAEQEQGHYDPHRQHREQLNYQEQLNLQEQLSYEEQLNYQEQLN